MPAGRPSPQVRKHTTHIQSVVLPSGVVWVKDDRRTPPVFTLESELELACYVHQNSTDEEYVPLGDMLHGLFEKLGVRKPCLPCAERQAWLNQLLKKE